MPNIKFSTQGKSPFQKLLGHNTKILKDWSKLEDTLYNNSSLELDLLEQVRRTLAYGNRCEYCMLKAGRANEIKTNNREAIATAFAELFSLDHNSITAEHFRILKDEFTEKEISELCSFISFTTASQKLGSIYNLKGDQE